MYPLRLLAVFTIIVFLGFHDYFHSVTKTRAPVVSDRVHVPTKSCDVKDRKWEPEGVHGQLEGCNRNSRNSRKGLQLFQLPVQVPKNI